MYDQNYSAGIGDLKGRTGDRVNEPAVQGREQPVFRWTARKAMASLVGAILFAWGFFHVVLTLIFATTPVHH